MTFRQALKSTQRNAGAIREAAHVGNLGVVKDLLGPAVRGYVLQRGKRTSSSKVPAHHSVHFDWSYDDSVPALSKLRRQATAAQWDAEKDLDWGVEVAWDNPKIPLIAESALPLPQIPNYQRLPVRKKMEHLRSLTAWMLSQFLHGEQGALMAACQLTESVDAMDAKLYSATQVADEARHVEVFSRYLAGKLEKTYEVNDNLYVILDTLVTDKRWDLKFLGMQIMVEGLALGAFGSLRRLSKEPLLLDLLRRVIRDEARHVHFGVLSLEKHFQEKISPKERREREDWAFEMSLLMRNRFLAHEYYEEYYAHCLPISEWNRLLEESPIMRLFREGLFRRVIPNLKALGLLSDRIRRHYDTFGMLEFEHLPALSNLDDSSKPSSEGKMGPR